MPDNTTPSLIVRTKLYRPSTPPDFVRRSRLQKILDSYPSSRLMLVSAAAGYGKTTLVSGWLEQLDRDNVWLSLDDSDNDLRQFASYIVAAVQSVFPTSLEETHALLEVAHLPMAPVLAGTLINELDALEKPLVMVLDDIHLIHDKAVNYLLREFLSHPPRGFHLVLVGRRDPLLPIAKLRALGQVTEIRAEILQFTASETASFLQSMLGKKVDPRIAATWTERTEGWVTGLRLASLTIRSNGGVPKDPFKPWKSRRQAMQYLLQEVLEKLEPQVFNRLLGSSIADRFCASLCNVLQVVGGQEDNHLIDGEAFIAWLEATGLFLIPLDAEHGWFRFHHLFQDMLKEELKRRYGENILNALHLQAFEWFAAEGLVDEALKHALAAGAVSKAAELIGSHRQEVMNQGAWFVLDKWLSMLPDSVVQARPGLLLGRAWGLYYHFRLAAIPPLLDTIDDLLKAGAAPHGLAGEVGFFRGVFLLFGKESAHAALACFEAALAQIPETNHEFRSKVELNYCLAGQMDGQSERIFNELNNWLHTQENLHPLRNANLLTAFVVLKTICADIDAATPYIIRLRDVSTAHKMDNYIATSDYFQGHIHLQRNELDSAIHFFNQALERRYSQHAKVAADSMTGLALAYQMRRQPDSADTTLKLLDEYITALELPFPGIFDSCKARLALLRGQPVSAIHWLKSSKPRDETYMAFGLEISGVTRCRVLIAEGSTTSLQEAELQLQAYEALNESQQNNLQLITMLSLQSMVYDKQEKQVLALCALERALVLARPGGIVLPFLELGAPMAHLLNNLLAQDTSGDTDFIKQVLTAIYAHGLSKDVAKRRSARGSALPRDSLRVPLTTRELAVLEQLRLGLYQKEIAARLFVSPETVKTHLKHIYQKLGVRDRRHAVERANTLDLITPTEVHE
ncbi:MAG: LuxR C-terminal-related transcriptional regulator [Pseudomonadales bacterium]